LSSLARRAEGTLEHGFVQVVTSQLALRASVVAGCGKDPLPRPFSLGKRLLVEECTGKLDVARASLEVCAVGASNLLQVGV
jgi:hypothetical protein